MKNQYSDSYANSVFSDPIRTGVAKTFKKDIYYILMESSWKKIVGIIFSSYILINLFFGLLYFLIPGSIAGQVQVDFWDAFFFSVQTMSTIGYGEMYPSSYFSNIVVTVEAAFGLTGIALITGLIFARVSKPHAKILFSKNMMLAKFNGVYCLMFRLGNTRGNDIVEAHISVSALIDEVTAEGEEIRRVYDLKLRRDQTPFFKLTWSVFHELDETSPLNMENLFDGSLKIITITVTGHDGTFSSTVYSRHVYEPEDIIKDRYFKNIMTDLPSGHIEINYNDFHTLKD